MSNTKDSHSINRTAYFTGLRDSVPIALGYMAVSFSLGMMAKRIGLTPLQGFISSFVNHASAGEYAEFTVMKAGASFLEMAIIIFITNLRYSLMSLSYSQRFAKDTSLIHRFIMCFGISDEIYGVTIARSGDLVPAYTYGVMSLALPFWCTGTALGIMVGNILPTSVVGALSVALYGMFLAIIIPPAKKDKIVAILIVVSFALSYIASKLPIISTWTESMRTIVLTLIITGCAAMLFPKKEFEEGGSN